MTERGITNMGCVPKVLELFGSGIKREIRRRGKERQFQLLHSLALRLPLTWRRRFFGQIHQRLGGNFRYFVSGGARLDPELARWWEGLGFMVMQGYGMTEAAPVVTTSSFKDRDYRSVGRPLPGVGVRIGDDDEIMVRGENVTSGYWLNPELTAAAFTDGWYHTGDQGYLDPAGRLHILGRRDFMIVLPNGMNVYPEDLEQELLSDERVRDAVVLGLDQQGDVAIHAVLILTEPGPAGAIVREANRRLSAHQRIEGFTLWPDEAFPMTPTMKPKRQDILNRLAELKTGE
jgi:long-chain acyl-CoA synthetase